jgi:protein-disulfide isomerase/Spy/CpxP family protein refolding chaperone
MIRRHTLVAALALAAAACQSPRQAPPTQGGHAQKQDPNTPVAKIGGQNVTAGELDELVKADLQQLDQQYQKQRHDLRRQALDALVTQRVVEAKAKAENVEPQALVRREVEKRVPEPSDEEIRAIYDRAKAGGQELPPLDQVKPDIARFIKSQKAQGVAGEYYEQLKKEANVEILLAEWEPPKVQVDTSGPAKGPANAPVTIVEFSDFECPFCVRAEPTVKQVLDTYGEKVRLVFKDFPLPNHTRAPKASEAAHCAGDQGKFWEMHEKLFAAGDKIDVPDLKAHAREVGLDGAKFDACLDSGEKAKLVQANRKAGEEAGVTGTPAFFVNGRLISGAQPFEEFKKIIDKELASAGK